MERFNKINIEEIAKNNSFVDLKQVKEVSKIVKELQSLGFTKHEYDLVPPFTRRPYN